MATYGVWFQGRNTPKIVTASTRSEATKKARRSKTAGNKAAIVSARRLTGASLRQANKGRWVRERANGSQRGGSFKYRPQLKKRATRVLSKSQRRGAKPARSTRRKR